MLVMSVGKYTVLSSLTRLREVTQGLEETVFLKSGKKFLGFCSLLC